jgi:ribulose-5-phosphate 4-epimerase/fuculose-1-phosphate aldolase
MSHDTTMSEVRRQVTPEEWQTRVELAAAYRLVAHFGWDDLIFTHISARVPGQPGQFLINPYGMLFDEITASSLVKVDHEGQPMMETEYDVNPAGFVIHSAIHDGRPEVQCVHTHTRYGVAVSAQRRACCPSRSSPSSRWRAWPTTTTRAWPCAMTRSRAWWTIWVPATSSSCATTGC